MENSKLLKCSDPFSASCCCPEFIQNLTVRNKDFTSFVIIPQIAKMNQQRQHIVLSVKSGHVILISCRIYTEPAAIYEQCHCIF